jgi:hypothetical protein
MATKKARRSAALSQHLEFELDEERRGGREVL